MSRPFETLNSGSLMVFDGLEAVCWLINMQSSVTSPRITNIAPGQLYTFIFAQNATGGHTMNWPANCQNAAPIDPAPNSTTVQNFVGSTGGILIADIPPTGVRP